MCSDVGGRGETIILIMASFNKVILAGNLTMDPEVMYLPTGTPVANFSIAVNRKWKTEGGEAKEEVSYFQVVAFGKTAETIGQYLKKGKPILIEGRLKQERWEDKTDGRTRQAVKVHLESFTFLNAAPPKGERGDEGDHAPSERAPAPSTRVKSPRETVDAAPPMEDDDVPF